MRTIALADWVLTREPGGELVAEPVTVPPVRAATAPVVEQEAETGEQEPAGEASDQADSEGGAEPEQETGEQEPAGEADSEAEAEPQQETGVSEPEDIPDERPVDHRPLLRKERALDPDWIGARPLFRDEAPARKMPRIEFEPSAEASGSRKPSRATPMRSVVLGAQANAAAAEPTAAAAPVADADPPTLIDRMPPIDPDDLVVPDFLRADFTAPGPTAEPAPQVKPRLAARPKPKPHPRPQPAPEPDAPTLIDPHPAIPAAGASVPDFVVPGFAPAPKPPLRTVLSTVLGPELWDRCYSEWGAAHCTSLARIARGVDGLAPSAGTAVRSTAGAGMRWLGVARQREMLAELVAEAISHPAEATATNRARTVRLYGAAICVALNLPLRRCACHRDLDRDVSSELIRLGLAELAGEVP